MEFGEHVKLCCARFKTEEVGLETFGEFTIHGHTVNLGRNCSHMDGGEICGLGFIVDGVVELAGQSLCSLLVFEAFYLQYLFD